MRSPSARVLANTANIYNSTSGEDASGGVTFPYPATPTIANVPCSAQADGYFEEVGEDNRITQVTVWKLIFGGAVSVTPRDKIVTTDPLGVTRTMFVEAARDNAGRNGAFTVRAIERQ